VWQKTGDLFIIILLYIIKFIFKKRYLTKLLENKGWRYSLMVQHIVSVQKTLHSILSTKKENIFESWGSDSRATVLAWHVWGPEFNSQYHKERGGGRGEKERQIPSLKQLDNMNLLFNYSVYEIETQTKYFQWKQPGIVAYACNPSYLGGWNQEDLRLSPARANRSRRETWVWWHMPAIPAKMGNVK
jgi:hypothetical protein